MAEELQLKGLMGSGAGKETEEAKEKFIPNKKPAKPVNKANYVPTEVTNPDIQTRSVDKVEPSLSLEGAVAVTDYTVAADLQDLDDKIKSMMEVSENVIGGSQGNKRKRICKICGKEGQWVDIRNHIESHHITGVSHTCDICGTVTRSRHALSMHKHRKHTTN